MKCPLEERCCAWCGAFCGYRMEDFVWVVTARWHKSLGRRWFLCCTVVCAQYFNHKWNPSGRIAPSLWRCRPLLDGEPYVLPETFELPPAFGFSFNVF